MVIQQKGNRRDRAGLSRCPWLTAEQNVAVDLKTRREAQRQVFPYGEHLSMRMSRSTNNFTVMGRCCR